MQSILENFEIIDQGQGCQLTIETHVLGKGLRQHDVMALLNEVANSPGITVNVSTCKALIGHVEEHKQVSLLQDSQGGKEQVSLTSRKQLNA